MGELVGRVIDLAATEQDHGDVSLSLNDWQGGVEVLATTGEDGIGWSISSRRRQAGQGTRARWRADCIYHFGETGERSGDIGDQVEFGQRSAAKKDGPSRRSLVAEYQRLTALVRYGARPHDAGGTREKLVTAHSAFQRAFQQAASTIRVRSLSQLPVRRAPRGPAIYMYLEAQYCRLSCGD